MRFTSSLAVMLALLTAPLSVLAEGFGINATRLIYPEGAASISVTVRNTMDHLPYLVQTGISQAQDKQTPAPFTATPPLFRLEPKSVNQIRIALHDGQLPRDRESVFYLRASAIPASATPNGAQQQTNVQGSAQFGVGNIIKLFYRPSGLPATSADAQKNLQFMRVPGGIKVSNPSPYFVSFATLKVGEQKFTLSTPEALMIAPFGNHTYPASVIKGNVRWQTINDAGGLDAFTAALP